jgi:hypothetical protein
VRRCDRRGDCRSSSVNQATALSSPLDSAPMRRGFHAWKASCASCGRSPAKESCRDTYIQNAWVKALPSLLPRSRSYGFSVTRK